MTTYHRLVGLEPDNLLAFLALLGLLRALEAAGDEDDFAPPPRAFFDVDTAPLRPVLVTHAAMQPAEIAAAAARGVAKLASYQRVGNPDEIDLNFTQARARELLKAAQATAATDQRDGEAPIAPDRHAADVLAALFSDGAIKENEDRIDPTPLCLLFGQGHQHFLDRFADLPMTPPSTRGRGKAAVTPSIADSIEETLFAAWKRHDSTASMRWDLAEDVRYALLPGDPTVARYKAGTQHGANVLAAIGLSALPGAPQTYRGAARVMIAGGQWSKEGFSFAIPIWREPASLAAICALQTHHDIQEPARLRHLGLAETYMSRRISVGKFMNMTPAQVAR